MVVFGGFDGTSWGVCVFICVVFVVMCGVILTMRRLCELGRIAGVLIGSVGSVGGMSWCFLQMVIWVICRGGDSWQSAGVCGRGWMHVRVSGCGESGNERSSFWYFLIFFKINILFTFIFVWCVAWGVIGGVRWVSIDVWMTLFIWCFECRFVVRGWTAFGA